jgi:integrase
VTRPVRFQKGYLYQRSGSWFVQYRTRRRLEDGSTEFEHLAKLLGSVEEFPTANDVEPVRLAFMQTINGLHSGPDAGMTLSEFVITSFLPWSREEHRASTSKGYREIWENHIRSRLGNLRVREIRTVHVSRLLREIAQEKYRAKNTLQHIKSVLSGIMKYAKNEGAYDGANPVQDALIPSKTREQAETFAYDLNQISQILMVMPLLPKAIIATTAFAGLRRSELRGFQWTDYTGEELTVNRSIWRTVENLPKTKASRQSVPVIGELAAILEEYRASMQNPNSGFVFPAENGGPVDLDKLALRVIGPAVEAIGLPWYGWHGFRRGIASNLYALGANDKVVQRILRHAKPHVTRERYIKAFDPAVLGAMQKMQASLDEMKRQPMATKNSGASGKLLQ